MAVGYYLTEHCGKFTDIYKGDIFWALYKNVYIEMEEQLPSESKPPETSKNEFKEKPPNDRTGDSLTDVRVDESPAKFTNRCSHTRRLST